MEQVAEGIRERKTLYNFASSSLCPVLLKLPVVQMHVALYVAEAEVEVVDAMGIPDLCLEELVGIK